MKKNVDLALPSYAGGSIAVSDPQGGPEYPTVHLDGKDELNLPDSGIITFQYRLRSETSSKNKDGSHRYQCTLDIQKLVSVAAGKDERPSKRDTTTEDTLDKLMKDKEKASDGDGDGED